MSQNTKVIISIIITAVITLIGFQYFFSPNEEIDVQILESDFFSENEKYIEDIGPNHIKLKIYDKKDPYVTYYAKFHKNDKLSYMDKYALQRVVDYIRNFDSFKFSNSDEVLDAMFENIIDTTKDSDVGLMVVYHKQGSEIPEDYEF